MSDDKYEATTRGGIARIAIKIAGRRYTIEAEGADEIAALNELGEILHAASKVAYEEARRRTGAGPRPLREERATWEGGDRIGAVKAYRTRTGAGLAEAVDALGAATGRYLPGRAP